MTLGRHLSVIGIHTALGRFLGYVRDTIIVAFLGASGLADALFIATKLASLFRRLFTEGAFNASFIPIFSSLLENKGKEKATGFAVQSLMAMFIFVGAITIYVLMFTESFVGLTAAGFKSDPAKFQWTVELTQIIFPFILVVCLTAVIGAVLNALHNFVQTAASQTLANSVIIILFLILKDSYSTYAHAAAWAITVSAIVQFIWLYVVAVRMGVVMLPQMPRLTKPLVEFMKRLIPGIFGTGMVQINILVSIYFGSYLKDGGVSYLQITERVNQFPLSIIGVSLGTVLIPLLSTQLQKNDLAHALDTQNKAISVSLALSLPIAAITMVFAHTIIAALFMHGKFSLEDVGHAAPCLIAFISGLPAYVLLKVFSSTFFALKDTLRPSIAGGIAMIINGALCYMVVNNMILISTENHIDIAIALTISGWINTILLGIWALKLGYFKLDKALIKDIVRIKTVTIIIVSIAFILYPFVAPLGVNPHFWVRALTLVGIVILGAGGFIGFNCIYKRIIRTV